MTTHDETLVSAGPGGNEWRVTRGLLWLDWLRMCGYILPMFAIWLVGIWVVPVFYHPAWVLAFGMMYVLVGATAFAAMDVMGGSEEFTFALPPTRAQLYLTRLLLGLGTTVAFTALGVLAVGLDLPQMLWGLFVNSGFTGPFPVCDEPMVYGLAIALPTAAFACVYSLASNAGTRTTVMLNAFAGLLLAGAVLIGGLLAEAGLWDRLNGYVSIPALLAITPMALLIGYGFYVRKEGINRPTPVGGSRASWVWVVIVVVVVVFIMLLSLLRVSHRPTVRDEEFRLEREAARDLPRPATEVGTATVPARPADNTTNESGEDGK
ncbi:MAG TPA: hypothetical protein VMZ92_09550 [Planctomycetota bacterium]|nr:hypothetical protein [Planctomycetota bacterium]